MIARRYILLFLIGTASLLQGMNLLRPYDSLLRPDYSNAYRAQWVSIFETGISDKAFDSSGKTNAMRIWNCDQNALKMLDGYCPDTEVGQKRIAVDANDDGVRGHFSVCGDLKNHFSGLFGMRTFFCKDWSLSLYLPVYSMSLTDVVWQDQTRCVTDEDLRVKELLTNDFACNVENLGCGLDICGWKRTGVGDLTLLVDWSREFPQTKEMLKSVRINWRAGLGIPTGLREDEDKVMAFAYGYDGAFSIPFGLGLDLHTTFCVRAGFDVQLTHIFGNTRVRRFKTSQDQTDLLFLQKAPIYKDWGLTQQFNLYTQLYKPFGEFSLLLGYQYQKHGDDAIALPCESSFSQEIANSAESLKDWTLHQFVFRADYDIGGHWDEPSVYPRLFVYAQIPFNGKRSVATTNIGFSFSLDF